MRLISTTAVAVGIALAGCTAESAAPTGDAPSFIVNGTPTGSAYGAVGALLFDFDANGTIDGDDALCTGSLISPTVFLTAAHCVYPDRTIPAGSQFYVSFAADLYDNSAKFIKATSYTWDPNYGHDQANLNDLAVVILPSNGTRGVTPVKLPTAGRLDELSAQGKLSKTLFVNVGYGVGATQKGLPGFDYDGLRKSSKSEFMGLQPTWLGLLMNTSATGEGGDCYGDSGGPKFIDGDPTTIYATVTTGDMNCRATTWDWRLDTPQARAFLGQFVALP